MAFVAVHRPGAYEPHATAVHLRGYLGKCHVIRLLHEADGRDEAVHVGRTHGHRLAIGAAFDETILERVGPGDNRIESVASSEHKKQVADKGDFLADATAATHGDLSLHGGEDLKSVGSELFVGGIFALALLRSRMANHWDCCSVMASIFQPFDPSVIFATGICSLFLLLVVSVCHSSSCAAFC